MQFFYALITSRQYKQDPSTLSLENSEVAFTPV